MLRYYFYIFRESLESKRNQAVGSMGNCTNSKTQRDIMVPFTFYFIKEKSRQILIK